MQTHKFKWKLFDVEYSSVKIWELEGEVRTDSEYYDVQYIKLNNALIKNNFLTWRDISYYIKKWIFDISPNYYRNEGIPFIRVKNCNDIYINEDDLVFLDENIHNENWNTELWIWDIVMSKVWTIWEVSINLKFEKINFSQNNVWIKVNQNLVNSYYLIAYLKSNSASKLIERKQSWNVQQKLVLEDIRDLKIPIPSQSFQEKIQELVIESYKQNELSENLYKEAESLLLSELDLLDYKPKTKNINLVAWYSLEVLENHSTTNYSILKELDRFDAEYWDYSYFEIIDKIKKYKWWFDKLTNLVKVSKKKITLDEEQVYNYIELADINKSNWMVENITEILWKDLPSRARMKIERWSVLFSSLEGSIDKVAIIDSDLENLVASTWFFIFKENILNKETLLVLLKIFWQKYISREALGTIMSAISNTWIERILLPKIDNSIQKIITGKIQESFTAKTTSKNLLEIAKKAVEVYIEEDESVWFEFIKNNV